MLSAYFLRKTHSIMTNCKFVIGNEVKHYIKNFRKPILFYYKTQIFTDYHFILSALICENLCF